MDATQIKEHMDVVGSDGQHIGTVDKMEGQRIKLTKKDPAAQGDHHYIAMDKVSGVEGSKVKLNCIAEQASGPGSR